MRPLRLSFQAFGPYEKETVLDFRALRGRSFFLIHGATGAGKTTLLDAICFALYGDASGEKREAKMLRSEQALPTQPTWVDFIFSLGEDIYHIWRSPEQLRAKKRGEGTTLSPADALLYKKGAEGEPEKLLAQGYSRVTEQMEALLGFKSSQFRQVVLLPQGEFRRLLLANSSERQEIMEVLFKTEVYRQLEEGLKAKARGVAQQHEKLQQTKELLLGEEGLEGIEEFIEKLQEKREQLQQSEGLATQKKKQQEAAQKVLQAAEELENTFLRLSKAEDELADCQKRQRDFEQYKKDFERAERAAALEVFEKSCLQARGQVKRQETACQEARREKQRLAAEQADVQQALERARAQEPERKAAEQNAQQLQDYEKQAHFLEEARENVAKAKAAFQRVQEQRKQQEEKIQAWQTQQEILTRDLQATEVKTQQISALQIEKQNLERLQLLEKSLKEQEEAYRLAEEESQTKQKAAACAQADYEAQQLECQRLQHLFSEGQAVLLAVSLADGSPCPVCGATEHPHRAEAADGIIPDEREVRKNQKLLQSREQARKKASDAFFAAENVKMAAKSRWEESKKSWQREKHRPENLQQAFLAVQQALQESRQAVQLRTGLLGRVEEEKILGERLTAEKERLDAQEKSLESAWHTAEGILQEKENLLPAAYREKSFLTAEKERAQAAVQVLQKAYEEVQKKWQQVQADFAAVSARLETLTKNAEEGKILCQDLEKKFQERLKAAGFLQTADYHAALTEPWNDPAFREKVKERIRGFEDRFAAARDAVARGQKEAAGKKRPDLEHVRAAFHVAESEWTRCFGQVQQEKAEIARREKKWQDLQKLDQDAEKIESAYRLIGQIADVANGKNAQGITFQRYVLRSLLEDVIDAANGRLLLMSRGQYRLQPGERARKNAAGGLDMEVFDEYTGYARPMATLSGGESFLAALSLALGLADVVQSYAGGIRLDTMFIDEGFGTLDTETLDMALKALLDLQKGGRLIGIISHVEELKERIDARLEITKTAAGSQARFVVG